MMGQVFIKKPNTHTSLMLLRTLVLVTFASFKQHSLCVVTHGSVFSHKTMGIIMDIYLSIINLYGAHIGF